MVSLRHEVNAGNPVKILKEVMHVNGAKTHKSFVVDVMESGKYYINTFFRSMAQTEYDVQIDEGGRETGYIRATKDGWQYAYVAHGSDESIKPFSLSKGEHIISFISDESTIPQIDEIRLG